jgi:hypothetical protein
LLLPACSKVKDPQAEMVRGQTVRGTVTYKGKPVAYGAVLFYNHEKSVDPATGKFWPSAFSTIRADGTYEIADAALGPVLVCVGTDPDVELSSLMRPSVMGGPGIGGAAFAGGPPLPHHPGFGAGQPLVGDGPPGGVGGPASPPPGGGAPSDPVVASPAGAPGPLPPGVPPGDGSVMGAGRRHHRPNPATAKLTDSEKQMLREIHAKFGRVGLSPLVYVVREGEQTYNIRLP